jgi:hypothetical protein
MHTKTFATTGLLTTFFRAAAIACVSFHTLQSRGAVNLSFSTGNYGLEGNGPGNSSSLLIDPNGIDSCHIITCNISPVGGQLHVAGLLGINSPGSDGDNLFEPNGAESWTFGWDQNVVLNSIDLLRASLNSPATSPLVMTIRTDAWIGQNWPNSAQDTQRVYNFDSTTGTFTFTGFPTNTESQTQLLFAPSAVIQSATLLVPAGASITIRNDGLTWAGIRGLNFTIVPEPSTATLLITLGVLGISARCRQQKLKPNGRPTETFFTRSCAITGHRPV